ncbi:hypothetical protein [Glycomyces tenuis]|nr:hypothetical protein [Glycomyces tenuis]
MIEDLWNDLLAGIFDSLWEIKAQLWDTVSGMYFETLYSYFSDSAGPMTDAFSALVMASYVGIVVAAGAILLARETLQTKYSLRELLPRLVIAILLVGLVKEITWQVYSNSLLLADAFTLSDRVRYVTCENYPDGSAQPIDPADCVGHEAVMRSEFANHAFMVATGPGVDGPVGLFDIGMQLVSIWIYLLLLLIFLLRNIAWFCVLIIAPMALACHALPQTERFAHYWWRLLGACLASSLGQCALIWVYHQLDGTFGEQYEEKYADDYHIQLFYLILIAWLMWKLHKAAFQLARGKTVKVPGSHFLQYLLLNRLMNGRSKSRYSGRRHRSRRRGDGESDDDAGGGSRNGSHQRPIRRYPESDGLQAWLRFRRDVDDPQRGRANHAGNAEAPGLVTRSGSAMGDPDRTFRPTGPVPNPSEVADRIETRRRVEASEAARQQIEQVPDRALADHDEFQRRAAGFHAHRGEVARRAARDRGAVRKRDRRADAADALGDVPRGDLRASHAGAWTGGEPMPRRAETRPRPRQWTKDTFHLGDGGTPYAPRIDRDLAAEVRTKSSREAEADGGDAGGERS